MSSLSCSVLGRPWEASEKRPRAVVHQQDIGLKLHGQCQIQIAVAVRIARVGIHALSRQSARQVGLGDVRIPGRLGAGPRDAQQRRAADRSDGEAPLHPAA